MPKLLNADFINAIKDLAGADVVTIEGKEFATKEVFNAPLPDEPLTAGLAASTLTGLVDYCLAACKADEKFKSEHLIHVRSYHDVALVSQIQGVRRQREVFVTANCGGSLFSFGKFMSHSEFMIAIQALFEDYGDRSKVMRVLGTVRDEAAKISQDDGITQKVTAAAGIALAAEVAIPNPVFLKPYRTFVEIMQPPSNFVLRVNSKNGGLPEVALFESDGGRWKIEAIQSIREYLAEKLEDMTIVA
jgi:hypothetical protein